LNLANKKEIRWKGKKKKERNKADNKKERMDDEFIRWLLRRFGSDFREERKKMELLLFIIYGMNE
jgi:hypothetical protein